jgi:hypothetical protein
MTERALRPTLALPDGRPCCSTAAAGSEFSEAFQRPAHVCLCVLRLSQRIAGRELSSGYKYIIRETLSGTSYIHYSFAVATDPYFLWPITEIIAYEG